MKMSKLKKLITFFTLFLITHVVAAMGLTHVEVSSKQKISKIEIYFTKPFHYQIFTLSNPNRLVVDCDQSHAAFHNKTYNQPIIKDLRIGQLSKDKLRLVFDLNSFVKFKTFQSGNKIAITMGHNEIKPIIIVIDPGHGGKDPGAIGPYGMKEKQIVLAIAKRLEKKINSTTGLHAILTRNDDYFVPLAERLQVARKGKADLFVSIHADSFFNVHSNGASVYALSSKGATSVAARWLAIRENHSELGGLDLRELEDQSPQLRFLLIDLAQTAANRNSLRLGRFLLQSLMEVATLHYSRVEQAPFMVLKSPAIPSILVEIGFLSNPKEEKKLSNPAYQNKLAQALFNGIQQYLQ